MNTYEEFLARYEHDPRAPINRGGQASIFKARDRRTALTVAIKRAAVREGTLAQYSVMNEFELARTLRHPNLLRYYNAFRLSTSMGWFDYGIMEYVEEGKNLDDFIRSFPDEASIKSVLLGILEGLKHLHESGIVHRDMKPSNILIKNHNGKLIPKIIDFGVSKDIYAGDSSSSAIVGTLEYMAPEQLNPSLRRDNLLNMDLWGFGVIVYRSFTGEMPFGSVEEKHQKEFIRKRVLAGRLPVEVSNIPEPYQTIVRRCLKRDPQERAQSVDELLSLLTDRSPEPDEPPDSGPEPGESTPPPEPGAEEFTYEETGEAGTKPGRLRNLIAAGMALFFLVVAGFFALGNANPLLLQWKVYRANNDFIRGDYAAAYDGLVSLASSGNFPPLGHYLLGEIYYQGFPSVEFLKDAEAALYHFEEAANAQLGEAMLRLGDFYHQGIAVPRDTFVGNNWRRQALEFLRRDDGNRVTAQAALGDLYSLYPALGMDPSAAFGAYQRAAEAGFPYAQWRLGLCYDRGAGTMQDERRAVYWCRQAADAGHDGSIRSLCDFYLLEKDTLDRHLESAQSYFKHAAEQGYAPAQHHVGLMHLTGAEGIYSLDTARAISWLTASAEQGRSEAQYKLGNLYEKGGPGIRNAGQAVYWYKQAALLGDSLAQNQLGHLYDQGPPEMRDYRAALYWYKQAAESGLRSAQWNLAIMYHRGLGTGVQLDTACYWYAQAARQGHEQASARVREFCQ